MCGSLQRQMREMSKFSVSPHFVLTSFVSRSIVQTTSTYRWIRSLRTCSCCRSLISARCIISCKRLTKRSTRRHTRMQTSDAKIKWRVFPSDYAAHLSISISTPLFNEFQWFMSGESRPSNGYPSDQERDHRRVN